MFGANDYIGTTGLYFNSVCLTLPALFFTCLIFIIYLKKGNENKNNNIIFITLQCIMIVSLILELVFPYTIANIDKYEGLNEFVCKLYIFTIFLWDECYLVYTFNMVVFDRSFQKMMKNKLLFYGGLIGIIFFPIISIILFPVEYVAGGVNGVPYTLSGEIIYFMNLFTIFGSFIILYTLAKNDKKIQNVFMLPLYCDFIFYFTVIILQLFFNYPLNSITFVGTTIIAISYFTFESQDNRLLYNYRKSKEEAEKLDEAKTNFLIKMSHEIRTPMNTLLGFADSLIDEKELTEDMLKHDLNYMKSSGIVLLDLIDSILDISKIENGDEAINNDDYTLESLLFEINSYIPSKIYKENLKFSMELNENLPKEFHGDVSKIFKIVTYILLNAIEHTDYGEVKLIVNGDLIKEGLFEFKFHIKNTGHAMSTESFKKEFDDFVSIESSSDNIDNIKLGVVIAKQLTRILKGKIDFINETGQGTQYIIRLRQRVIDMNPVGNIFSASEQQEVTSTNSLIDCTNKTALIVDDSEINLKLASRYVGQFGFKIKTATSGKETIDLVNSNKFDIIFLDHMMPDMDGIETIKGLYALGIELPPIIALTANAYDGLKERYVQEGFYDYIQKPIKFKKLNQIISKLYGGEKE